MVQVRNEEGKFTNDQGAEEKFAPSIPLTIRSNKKYALWIPKLLCIFFVSFVSYKLYTTFVRDADDRHRVLPTSLTRVIEETRTTLEEVRQANAFTWAKNWEIADGYLDGVQNALRKRVEGRVKQLSVLVLEKVQDIENQLSVFDRSISTGVDGNVDFTRERIDQINSTLNAITIANATSTLEDAVRRVEDEITKFTVDLDQMFSFYGRYVNDIIHHKTENITARIRMILVKDRKVGRNLNPQPRATLCYKISKQNNELCNYLEKVLDATNRLQRINDTMDVFSPALLNGVGPSTSEMTQIALNETKQAFDFLMNDDDNFLGTILKRLAYIKHLEMRNFIYQGYETAIRSLVPALEKVILDFNVVKDGHWQRIAAVLNPEIAEVSKLILSKVSLIEDDSRRSDVAQKSEFKSMYTMLANKFKNASSTVNQLFETKRSQMIQGLTLTLDSTLTEQLPLVATWSLLDYLPVETCPMSIDFQTYLKSTMDRRLHKNSEIVSSSLKQVLEVDAAFSPLMGATDAKGGELESSTDEFNVNPLTSTGRDSKQEIKKNEKIRSSEDDEGSSLLSV